MHLEVLPRPTQNTCSATLTVADETDKIGGDTSIPLLIHAKSAPSPHLLDEHVVFHPVHLQPLEIKYGIIAVQRKVNYDIALRPYELMEMSSSWSDR